jgi:hypothetical protein
MLMRSVALNTNGATGEDTDKMLRALRRVEFNMDE